MYSENMKTRVELWRPLGGLSSWADARNLGIAFSALGDPSRVQMLSCLLDDGAMDVSEFQSRLGISQPLASHHLGKLVDAGVLQREKEGRRSIYTITDGALERLSDALVRSE